MAPGKITLSIFAYHRMPHLFSERRGLVKRDSLLTNSGKTYTFLENVKKIKTVVDYGPLRLLASQVLEGKGFRNFKKT
jgi:hypothetical protein